MSDPKYPVERADLTRLPWRALAVVAKVIESGDKKYHQGDWIMAPERVDGRRDLASALRHIGEFVEGQDVDEDSGESPLAHAAARLLFLLEREARGIKGGGWRIGESRTFSEAMEHVRNSPIEEMPPGNFETWNPIADQEEIARIINGDRSTTFCLAFRDRGGRPYLCELDNGHDGPHSFTVRPHGDDETESVPDDHRIAMSNDELQRAIDAAAEQARKTTHPNAQIHLSTLRGIQAVRARRMVGEVES